MLSSVEKCIYLFFIVWVILFYSELIYYAHIVGIYSKKKKKKKKKNNESMYQDAVLHENMSYRLTKEEHSNQLSHLYCLIRVLYV